MECNATVEVAQSVADAIAALAELKSGRRSPMDLDTTIVAAKQDVVPDSATFDVAQVVKRETEEDALRDDVHMETCDSSLTETSARVVEEAGADSGSGSVADADADVKPDVQAIESTQDAGIGDDLDSDSKNSPGTVTQVMGEHNYRSKLRSSTEGPPMEVTKEEAEGDASDTATIAAQSTDDEHMPEVPHVDARQVLIMKQEVLEEDEDEDEEVDVEVADEDEKENLSRPALEKSPTAPHLPGAPGNGLRQCLICGALFAGLEPFRAHMLSRHMHRQPYTCMLCWKSFSTAHEIIRHTNNNCQEVLYKCQRCDRVWSSDSHHASCAACGDKAGDEKTAYTPFECAACGQAFTLLRQLTAHVKTHDSGEHTGKPYKCHMCSALYGTSVRLMIHARHHSPSKDASPARGPGSRGRPRHTAGSRARRAVVQAVLTPRRGVGRPRNEPHAVSSGESDADSLGDEAFVAELSDTEAEAVSENEDDGADSDGLGVAVDSELERLRFGQDGQDRVDSPRRQANSTPRAPLPPGRPVLREGRTLFQCHWCPKEFRFNHQVNVHMRSHLDDVTVNSAQQTPQTPRVQQGQQAQQVQQAQQAQQVQQTKDMQHDQEVHDALLMHHRKLEMRERFKSLYTFFDDQNGVKGSGSASKKSSTLRNGRGMSRGIGRGVGRGLVRGLGRALGPVNGSGKGLKMTRGLSRGVGRGVSRGVSNNCSPPMHANGFHSHGSGLARGIARGADHIERLPGRVLTRCPGKALSSSPVLTTLSGVPIKKSISPKKLSHAASF